MTIGSLLHCISCQLDAVLYHCAQAEVARALEEYASDFHETEEFVLLPSSNRSQLEVKSRKCHVDESRIKECAQMEISSV